jgi:hypothetical protein
MFAISRHASPAWRAFVLPNSVAHPFPRNVAPNFRLYLGDGHNNTKQPTAKHAINNSASTKLKQKE